MSKLTSKFQKSISRLYIIGIDSLHENRKLKTTSLDLKLIAINGITHAAKIANVGGKSLITLSGFLSELPKQIAPELEELENHTLKLTNQLTLTSITVKRLLQYSNSLQRIIRLFFGKNDADILLNYDYLSEKGLQSILNDEILNKLDGNRLYNIKFVINKNITILDTLEILFREVNSSLQKILLLIERTRRNALIADYMGSNIMIESSYLNAGNDNFRALVTDIKRIVNNMDKKLEFISDQLNEGRAILNQLNKR